MRSDDASCEGPCPLLAPVWIQEASLDLLSAVVSDLGLRVQEPRTHTLKGNWALSLEPGQPAVHFVRHGQCCAWLATAKHGLPLSKGSALLLSGGVTCALQALGPPRAPLGAFDWCAGSSLERAVFPPDNGGVLLVSARLDPAPRPGVAHPLPPMVLITPQRLPLPGFRDPVVETLIAEVAQPRQGATAIVQRLLEIFVIRGLRGGLTDGFWSAPGWLGILTDPVLRTGLGEAAVISPPRSVDELGSLVHRSPRCVRARAKALSGKSPGRLLRQLRMQRALQQLERESPRLVDIARELGYANVSTFCRAFRREVGCTPAEYRRGITGRPFPRGGRSGAPTAGSR